MATSERERQTSPFTGITRRVDIVRLTMCNSFYIHWRHTSHLRTIFLMMDGNFKLINLTKLNNQAEPSLWDGRGFFRAREALEAHYKEFKDMKIEVTCHLMCLWQFLNNFQKGKCRKFGVVENANSLKYRGQSITGVIMVFCRHGLVRPDCAVNLKKGEKYVLITMHKFICTDSSIS